MRKQKRMIVFCILLIVAILSACNSQDQTKEAEAKEKENPSETEYRTYTDYLGHKVEIPNSPKQVIYQGENYGDLLPLNADIIGGSYSWITGLIFEDQVKNVEDVGFPINLEKVLELKPDLIIIADTDEKVFEQLSKIAPTVVFDTFAPLENRLTELGDIVNKKQEATEWLKEYKEKEKAMWKQLLDEGILKSGETASVFTYYPGDRLFVMASTGLSQVLYHPDGFKPGDKIQPILDQGKGFEQISLELLPEFAGDRIFILTPETDEAIQSTKDMLNSPVWKGLPAVKNGKVYSLDILKTSSDASTREWLIDEIPSILKK
ncbi:ferrichrome ABC transporter substrate-binding protein [Solibacillus sp. R5-41]|uniref:ABC transporter substrate-binding protein n=1 Tax=Solibacillus sp. R5-41 TaxID=2048654 RepID=UPI000C1253DD|nr:ABC transporter substrate-binding protein [Solibacillus sp. R5-41]ATP41651.1 ferrichrome ABC transporter substrate-binding protein [Solibacillus sp. R5-41]